VSSLVSHVTVPVAPAGESVATSWTSPPASTVALLGVTPIPVTAGAGAIGWIVSGVWTELK
jgi:hypothetical protein